MSFRKIMAPVAAVAALTVGYKQVSAEQQASVPPVVYEIGDMQVYGISTDQAPCNPEIDVCNPGDTMPTKPPRVSVCGSLAVLRTGLEVISDDVNPLVAAADKSDVTPATDKDISKTLSALRSAFTAEYPNARSGETTEDLKLLLDIESVDRTTAEVIDGRNDDLATTDPMLLVELAEQAKGTVNQATTDMCIDKDGNPVQDNHPGILTASLTCKVIEVIEETTDHRQALVEGYIYPSKNEYSTTLPPKIPEETSTTQTTTVPRDPKTISVSPAFKDLETLLGVGFVQEFPGLVGPDADQLAGVQSLLRSIRALDKDSVNLSALRDTAHAAYETKIAYCRTDGLPLAKPEVFNTTTTSTLPEKEAPDSTFPESSTTTTSEPQTTTSQVVESDTPIAPPAVPIQQNSQVTG